MQGLKIETLIPHNQFQNELAIPLRSIASRICGALCAYTSATSRLPMKTLEALYFSKMRIHSNVLVFVVLACLGSGCAYVPQALKDIGAEPMKQCPKDISLETGEQSVVLASIETDVLFDAYYLLLEKDGGGTDAVFDAYYSSSEKDTGTKYFMELSPRKIRIPTWEAIQRGRFGAKTCCYVTSPGHYRITKVIGVMTSTGPDSRMIETSVEYRHTKWSLKGSSLVIIYSPTQPAQATDEHDNMNGPKSLLTNSPFS